MFAITFKLGCNAPGDPLVTLSICDEYYHYIWNALLVRCFIGKTKLRVEKWSFERKNGSDSFFPSKLHFSGAKLHFSTRNFIFPYKTSFFHTKLHFSTRNYIFLHETSFFHTKIPAQRVRHQITNKILTQILLLSNSTSNQ